MNCSLSRKGTTDDYTGTFVNVSDLKDFVAMTDEMMALAVKERASDIHLEPYFFSDGSRHTGARIRFRIDGVLKTQSYIDKSSYMGMVTRLKVLGKMNITEKRLPQDGKFFFQGIDVRISSIPDIRGEKLVLRLLSDFRQFKTIGEIGMSVDQRQMVVRMIQKKRGLILVCGPTGCGKSTTLYALIKSISGEGVNIISIEDPVEMTINGISQIQLQEKIGLDYNLVLKGMMRQDPDVIMIGEIRDSEVAKEAVRFAMTGHQVFTTLHTVDAVGSVKRLMEMGVAPYLISDVLTGVIAQRLVRRLCPACKEKYYSGKREKQLWNIPEERIIFRAKGCRDCGYTGYRERIGVFEMLEINENLKEQLSKDFTELKSIKGDTHFLSFSQSMRALILQGVTSIEEGVRVFGLESLF